MGNVCQTVPKSYNVFINASLPGTAIEEGEGGPGMGEALGTNTMRGESSIGHRSCEIIMKEK